MLWGETPEQPFTRELIPFPPLGLRSHGVCPACRRRFAPPHRSTEIVAGPVSHAYARPLQLNEPPLTAEMAVHGEVVCCDSRPALLQLCLPRRCATPTARRARLPGLCFYSSAKAIRLKSGKTEKGHDVPVDRN